MSNHLRISLALWCFVLDGALSGENVNWPGTVDDLIGDDVLVTVKAGSLRGKRQPWYPEAGGHINKIDSYLGIPFARPPVGKLRFKPPEPVVAWQGVRNATRYGYVCPQRDEYQQLKADEDCLTLNVYVPHEPDVSVPWPVMVYIHGGSYRVGTGASYMGNPLAQRGVIVVTINYRLCILGFISARNDLLPGNNGLLDQIEALKWVNQNIAAFKGDPNRVTIFGNSAGGASVGILMVSPPAKGLFQQSIVQSGSPLAFWALHNDTVDLVQYTRDVARAFKCTQDSFSDLVECLRAVPADFLGECTNSKVPSISVSNTNFRPHADGQVVPKDIRELYHSGHINPERVMAGVVDREWSRHIGMMVSDLRGKEGFDSIMTDGMIRSSFEEAIHDIFVRQFGWGESVAKVVLHEYTNWSHVDDPIENRERYITFMTDFGMLAPTVELAIELHERAVPVYAYRFNHRSTEDPQGWSSNAHLMELYYVFGSPFLGYNVVFGTTKDFSQADKELSRYMMTLWSDFAKSGNPTVSTSNIADWKPFSPNTTDYLAIHHNATVMSAHFNPDGASFWNKLIPSLRQHPNESHRHYFYSNAVTWFLVALCVILFVVILVLAVLLHRGRSGAQSLSSPVGI